jgi:hypothetical protein
MASIPAETVAISRSAASRSGRDLALPRRLMPAALLLPSLLFLAVFFALPALGLVSYSVLTQAADGTIGRIGPDRIPGARRAVDLNIYCARSPCRNTTSPRSALNGAGSSPETLSNCWNASSLLKMRN